MRLVLVSDLHGYQKTLDYLREIIAREKPDGVVISGDISMNSGTDFIEKLFIILEESGTKGYVVCGNADEGMARKMIDVSEYSINQVCRDGICGLCDHEEALQDPGAIVGKIFVSHRPPQASVLNLPLQNTPAFHISGHLHSRKLAKQYPSTFMIQVPTLQDGEYAVFKPRDKAVEFKKI